MLKFFRENEKIAKWIMVGGLVLLLISWLAFDYSSNSIVSDWLARGRTWAMVGSEEASAGDLQHSQQQLAMLEAVGSPVLTNLGIDKDPGHWYLLVREAGQAGLIGPPADGERALASRLQGQQTPVDPNLVIRQLMGASGLSHREVLQTLADEAGVMRLMLLVSGAGPGRVSSTRLKQEAARRLMAIDGQILLVDAATAQLGPLAPIAEPTEEQLAAQLKTYGNVVAGSGENGFGYQIPNRIRYEWLSIPATTISAAIEKGPDLSNIALRKYFLENEGQFIGANAAVAASRPEFEQYQEAVRAALLAKLTKERTEEIAKFATDRLGMQLRGVARAGGYVQLPEGWESQRLAFDALAGDIATRFGIAVPSVIGASEAWTAPADLAAVPGLGTATTAAFGARGVRVSELAAAIKEFGGNPTLVAQAGVAMPVFTAPGGDLFIARITDAESAHAPVSVDEVREALTRDVRRVETYAALQGQLDSIKAAAVSGLAAAATAYGGTTSPFTEMRISNPQFLQYGIEFGQPLPLVGANVELQADIVKTAMALPSDKSAAEIPLADRTIVVPLPRQLAVAVVQIDSISPMNETQLADALKGNGLRGIVGRQGAEKPLDAFSYSAMRVRHQFVPLAEKDGGPEPSGAAEGSTK